MLFIKDFSEIMSTMVKRRFSPRDKEIFLSIMKTSEGGRFWNIIVVGDGDVTNQDKIAVMHGLQWLKSFLQQWP